jgi:hypothetical protein
MTHDEPEFGVGDEAAIRVFMQRVADIPLPLNRSLPSAESMLRQAQWRRRWEGERRMQRPLDVMLPLQIAAGLGAIAVLLLRGIPLLAMTLQNLT